ncbi:hypothetical protein HK104_007093 [Borealophlyctis nickersoniae]|nr:hypothetical protein HK104_007093 [Borealophlyctis nickersoniae]
MTFKYEPIVSSPTDILINVPSTSAPESSKLPTAVTPSSGRKPPTTDVASSPDKPVVFKHRTEEAYRNAVGEFKRRMSPVYFLQ